MAENQIGVLIDYENVGLGSMHRLFDQLSDLGRITVKRAYADWSKTPDKSNQMSELGIEAKHYFRPHARKNASDICLVIDAIELMFRSPIDTFVIVSSDTDFLPLVSTLRAAGKTVIGAGKRSVVSPALVHSCDRYIFYEEGDQTTLQDNSLLGAQAESLLERAMDASMDDSGRAVAAKLHQNMLRMDPSFDYRALGHLNFFQFLSSNTLVKVNRPRGHGDMVVELKQTTNLKNPISVDIETQDWDAKVDAFWAKIPGEHIAGAKASMEAAKALGISKISASRFKTLQGLLDASELLAARWARSANTIHRRTGSI